MEGLNWQTMSVPFIGGLNTKLHDYALEAPGLAVCKNVEFDEVGGLRLRKPFASIGTNIYPSGTISNPRKLAVVGDELLLFTDTTLYSWSETLTAWVSKGTHLAVKTEEVTRFGNTSDQVFADRAQLSGVIVYTWSEVQTGGTIPYLAAIDATTGDVLIAPTSLGSTRSRPRVVATATRILVFWILTGTGFQATLINPASPTFSTSGATTLTAVEQAYDVVKNPNGDAAVFVQRNAAGTGYTIGLVSSAAALSSSATNAGGAWTADGIIALACSADGNTLVLRTSGNNIRGDQITTSTLVNTANVDLAIGGSGSAINQVTAAYRSTTDGGYYRCYVFWSSAETTASTSFLLESNWADTNGTLGTEATLVLRLGVASRAFSYNGYVYVWGVFAGLSGTSGMSTTLGLRAQNQNTYFLYRDDGEYIAKAVCGKAAGFTYTSGHLPGVALVSGSTGFAWCGVERQVIITGGTDRSNYGARTPRDITFTFDSDDARRTAQVGRTLYVSGSPILQYDGTGLVEVGFEQFPWYLDANATNTGGLAAGTYSYKSSVSWQNERGEVERSSTAIGAQMTVVLNDEVNFAIVNTHVTRKQGTSRRKMATELWRTKVSPQADSPFYLTTSKDPSATGDNRYVENDPTLGSPAFTYVDNMVDATLETKEQNPENGGELPRLPPPPATILAATATRLFLAGVPGEPNRIWYSFARDEHEICAFAPVLSLALPTRTGAITALAILNETLVAFTATAIYAIPGDGYDNTGGGTNYGPARLLSSDVGALAAGSVAVTPQGIVFFSRKGWYRLGRGWEVEYIGAAVEAYNTDSGGFIAAHVVEAQHQVRFLSGSRMLVWDYLVNQWSEWSESSARDLAIWRTYPMLLDSAVKKEQSTFSSVAYDMQIETGWIRLNGIMGYARTRWLELLGEYKANHRLRIQLYKDYDTSIDFNEKFITNTSAPSQTRVTPTRQRAQALKVRVTVQTAAGATPAFDAITLVGLELEVGLRRGLRRNLASTRKV